MTAIARAVLPSPRELVRALDRDLAWISQTFGSDVRSAEPVSPLRGRTRPRTAFHVQLRDGREVKLRRMKTAERAEDLARLLERAAPLGLPQPLRLHGESLVLAWIEGVAFAPEPDDLAAFDAAGGLLGRIHAIPDFEGQRLPCLREAHAELESMQAQLAALVESGHVDAGTAARVRDAVARRLRRPVLHGLAHGDFAAENLLRDPEGRLRVIDCEGLQLGSLELDLARTWSRWPMSAGAWRAFLAGYAEATGRALDDAALLPWRMRTLVLSAWYRMAYGLAGAEEPLARLRALADGDGR